MKKKHTLIGLILVLAIFLGGCSDPGDYNRLDARITALEEEVECLDTKVRLLDNRVFDNQNNLTDYKITLNSWVRGLDHTVTHIDQWLAENFPE